MTEKERSFGLGSLCLSSSQWRMLLRVNLANGRTYQGEIKARLANVSTIMNESVRRLIFQSNTSSSAPLCAVSVSTLMTKWYKVFCNPAFADSKPIWNASESGCSTALGLDAFGRLAYS